MDKAEGSSGWVYATIGDVVASNGIFTDGDWVETKDQDLNGGVRLIQLADIGDGSFLDKSSRFLTRAKAHQLNCTFLTKGDLLVARMPDPLGRCCIFTFDGVEKYVTVVDVCVVRLGTSPVAPKYMMYLINSPRTRADIDALKSGSTRKRISRGNFASVAIPLAPQNEQIRIVAKIEELFSELAKGVESLKTAREQLKVYRQAVLKHAFEGKLTAQWREENKDKLEKPEQLPARIKQEREARYERQLQEWRIAVKEWEGKGKPGKKPGKPMPLKSVWQIDSSKIKQLPSIPDGWQWVSFSWLLSTEKKSIKTGPFGTMLKKHEHQEVGVPVLGIENIGGGRFIKGNKIFVSEKKAVALRSFEVEPGELIISRSGTVGEICTVPEGLGKTLISTNLLRVSLNQNVVLSQIFVFMFQGGGAVRKQVKELCKGSSRDFLNQSILQSVVFPICSLQEQIQIIREIGKRLSLTDQLLRSIDSELVKSSSLRQSILKKAFSGQLVAQDPSDEPTSVLLARIKAEKEQIGKKTETTRKPGRKRTSA